VSKMLGFPAHGQDEPCLLVESAFRAFLFEVPILCIAAASLQPRFQTRAAMQPQMNSLTRSGCLWGMHALREHIAKVKPRLSRFHVRLAHTRMPLRKLDATVAQAGTIAKMEQATRWNARLGAIARRILQYHFLVPMERTDRLRV